MRCFPTGFFGTGAFMDQWYIAHGKVKLGGYSWEQLRSLASDGDLVAPDMLLQDGSKKWIAACEIPGLFSAAASEPSLKFADVIDTPPAVLSSQEVEVIALPIAMLASPEIEAPSLPIANLAELAIPSLASPVASTSLILESMRHRWLWFAGGAVGLFAIVIAAILLFS